MRSDVQEDLRVMPDACRWTTQKADEDSYPVFAALFEESFGQRMTEPEWRWKYGAGGGYAYLAWSGMRAVAHYGALTKPVRLFGEPVLALQPVDVLVSPSERGVMTRRGPMRLTAEAVFDQAFDGSLRHAIGLGFPTARHLKLARLLGLFDSCGRMLELRWPVLSWRPSFRVKVREANLWPAEHLDAFADEAWRAMADELRAYAVVVRDGRYLRHRYLEHPSRDYRIFAVSGRFGGRPVGVLVLRVEARRCEVLDIIGSVGAFPLLVEVARRLAARLGADELATWLAKPFVECLASTGAVVSETDVQNLALMRTGLPAPEQMMDRWWLSPGDTDFR